MQYLLQILHLWFKVCQITKPLEVFSETGWLNALPLFLRMYKTIIEFGFRMMKFMNYQNLVSVLSASVDNTDLGFDNS